MKDSIRVRIAPSPTGFLHVGTARTALFNFLFARNNNGKFLLRIEDTDLQRSNQEMVNVILESLKWLGLNWDEEPVFQSKRLSIYEKYAKELYERKIIYPCYCTKEELEERKKLTIAQGKPWKYDRKCLKNPRLKTQDSKLNYALRFFVPSETVSFKDSIHGILKRDSQDIEDFVVVRSDGMATYNFACCIDDHEMGITHIIRGEDHISNTFKQILIYKAFGWTPPEFIHLPLLLGPDRSKLSKRHGALSVLDYKKQGFLPDCFLNFLALLGWSPGGDREIMSLEEIIKNFTLDKLSKTGAIFDVKKLEWMNGEYINKLTDEELLEKIMEFYPNLSEDKNYLLKVAGILKERMKTLKDFLELGDFFFKVPKEYDEKGVKKFFKKETLKNLSLLKERFEKLDTLTVKNIEETIRFLAAELKVPASVIIHPVRLALTGRTVGPSLFHLAEILGKERVIHRLENAIKFIDALPS